MRTLPLGAIALALQALPALLTLAGPVRATTPAATANAATPTAATPATSTATAAAAAATAHTDGPVRLPAGRLLIDRTEVTIGQFARFVQATGLVTAAEREGGGFEYLAGWQRQPGTSWRRPDGGPTDPALPAVHLTHGEAAAYCRWAGGRLPSAAEWLGAAYTEQRAAPPPPFVTGKRYPYPTGQQPDGANTNAADPWPRAALAGATRAGVNGLHEMGANVWEWVADAQGDQRRTMGGSWWYGPSQMQAEMQAQVQAWKPADFYAVYIGLRCVADRPPG